VYDGLASISTFLTGVFEQKLRLQSELDGSAVDACMTSSHVA
jgi:hypothetical protein